MEVTKIVHGMPEDVKNKRILRIKEAISFPSGTFENPKHNVVGIVNDCDVYFNKPGKEASRKGDAKNINDMAPGVGNLYIKYSFGNIWNDLLKLSFNISEDSFKKICVFIYRLAYLIDCEIINGKVRFAPSSEVMSEINSIQEEIDENKYDFKLLEFLNFIDVLGWNEDVKYQSDMEFKNYFTGRINNILSMISLPLLYNEFIYLVVEKKDNLKSLDFNGLISSAQRLTQARGIGKLTNKELLKYLSPYLIN